MKINAEGLALLKDFESCRLKAYRDIVGILTIGWGHTGPEVSEDLEWTQAQCDEQLAKDLTNYESAVEKSLKVQCTTNEFSALVCFCYNVGIHSFKSSTLLNCINKHNKIQAAGEFIRWNKAKGIIVPGLTRRREAEKALFVKS